MDQMSPEAFGLFRQVAGAVHMAMDFGAVDPQMGRLIPLPTK